MKSVYSKRKIDPDVYKKALIIISVIVLISLSVAAIIRFGETTYLQRDYTTTGTLIRKSMSTVKSGKTWHTRYYLYIKDDVSGAIHNKSVQGNTYRSRRVGDIYDIHNLVYYNSWTGWQWNSVSFDWKGD